MKRVLLPCSLVMWMLLATVVFAQETTADGGLPRSAAGQILFTRDEGVYVINGDGSGEQQLFTVPEIFPLVTWMPDGNQIVYADGGSLYLVQADGSNPQQLFATTAASTRDDLLPSPDGTHLLWSVDQGPGNTRSIYVGDIVSGEVQTIVEAAAYEVVSWLADSSHILVYHDAALYVVSLDGGDERLLAEGEGALSPDGTLLASFAGNTETISTAFTISAADAGSTLYSLEQAGLAYSVSWSPDGHYAGYVINRLSVTGENLASVETIDATSGEVRIHTPTHLRGEYGNISWSPDSQHIAFTARAMGRSTPPSTMLYVVSLDSESIAAVAQVTSVGIAVGWRP
ncbi:MAG: hypothetical protein U0694_12975 [Anaerolineae bacterium]